MMTDENDKQQRARRLIELERLTDAYGGNEVRWPEPARARLKQLTTQLPDAGRLLAQARALDRALDLASTPNSMPGDRALADRIVAAALRASPQPAADIVSLPRYRTRVPAGLNLQRPLETGRIAAAVMAACLLVGILLGGTVRVDPVLQDVADAVGLPADFEVMSTALADDAGEEDAL